MTPAAIVYIVISTLIVLFVIILVKDKGGKIQELLYPYPLSSKPGDSMFPSKGDTAGWIAYILMCLGLLVILVYIGSLVIDRELPFIVPIIGLTIFHVGGIAQGIRDKLGK